MPQPVQAAYTIGPEDKLDIVVYGQEDLSRQVVISPDGTFSYPLLRVIQASGLTTRQLEKKLAKELEAYLVEPQVTVEVVEVQSQQVHVLGEVREPGVYELKHALTLRELLAKAGGPTPEAGWEVVVVRALAPQSENREPAAKTEPATLRIDLEQLLSGQVERPVVMQAGDTVYLPQAKYFYVSGEVERPGRYRLERDTTVAKALTVAGGITKFAAKSRLKVRRLIDGQRQEFRVEYTDLLLADDILIAPQSIF